MSEFYKLDPTYSIIYHSENLVEFRNGAWNVISHTLLNNENNNSLAKIILMIEKHGFNTIDLLAKQSNCTHLECKKVINALHEKKLLLNYPLEDKNYLYSKIILIGDEEITDVVAKQLEEEASELVIQHLKEEELSFITAKGEEIFRDNLLLEKLKEQADSIFSKSLVALFYTKINPTFMLFLNKVLYESKIPWFFSALDGPFIYIGPYFSNNFCYECLDNRILMNAKNSESYISYKKAIIENKIKYQRSAANKTSINLIASLSILEIQKILTTGNSIAHQKLLSLYLPMMEFSYHKVLRLPACNICGIDNAFDGHQLHFDSGELLSL